MVIDIHCKDGNLITRKQTGQGDDCSAIALFSILFHVHSNILFVGDNTQKYDVSFTYLIPAKSLSHHLQLDKKLDANKVNYFPECFLKTRMDRNSANHQKSLWDRVAVAHKRYEHGH